MIDDKNDADLRQKKWCSDGDTDKTMKWRNEAVEEEKKKKSTPEKTKNGEKIKNKKSE